MLQTPKNLFGRTIDDQINKPTGLTPTYTFDIEGQQYTVVYKPTGVVAFYDSSIEGLPVPDADLNILKHSDYIFSATVNGVTVYDTSVDILGTIDLPYTSCIGATNNVLYIGTTNSGIYQYDISLVASGIFNQYDVFKQEPEITSNEVRYINCANNYVLTTTPSGVNQYNLNTSDWYKCYSDKEIRDCFQTSDGCVYYVSRDSSNTLYDEGSYLFEIKLNRSTGVWGNQVHLVFQSNRLNYANLYENTAVLKFFSTDEFPYDFFLKKWDYEGNVDVWVDIPVSNINTLYMLVAYDEENLSDAQKVFYLYDDFTNSISGSEMWYIDGDESGFEHVDSKIRQNFKSGHLVHSGTLNFPCTVQQKIHVSSVENINRVYGCILDPYDEGIYWYHSNSERTFDVKAMNKTEYYYNPANEVVLQEGLLSVGFDTNRIDFSFKNSEVDLVDSWACNTYNGSNRSLKLFGQSYHSLYTDNLFTDPSACSATIGNNPEKVFISGEQWNEGGITETAIWYYDFGPDMNIAINRVYIKQGWGGYYFSAGEVAVSNDGVNYKVLGVFETDMVGGRTIDLRFSGNTSAYRYFRLTCNQDYDSVGIETLAAYGYYDRNPELLNGFEEDRKAVVELDEVKVFRYGGDEFEVKSIEEKSEKLSKRNELNVLYNVDGDWADNNIDYKYNMDGGVFINDIFITENTSINSNQHVIFLGTSNGIVCIEEKRYDENNCRIKYYKTV